MKIPSFEGKCDPDVYMVWETKIEQFWSCHNFPEHKKVQLAALEFNEYALIWWDNMFKERGRTLDALVATWEQMKALMRARFVPQHYTRELRQRIENLRQGSMSAEETYNTMQVAMVRANVTEDEETTIVRYLCILNSTLANEVDLFPYGTMTELLHLAIKVERKSKVRYQGNPNVANKWRDSAPTRDYPGAKNPRCPFSGTQPAKSRSHRLGATPNTAPHVPKPTPSSST